jgi:hypothetical protein
MARTILVKVIPLAEGRALVDLLLPELDLKAALWLYFDESDEWRLVLASPLVDKEGPRRVYERIQRALSQNQDGIPIPLSQVSVLGPDDPIIKPLTEALDDKGRNADMHVKGGVVTGGRTSVYLEEAYIYFAHK